MIDGSLLVRLTVVIALLGGGGVFAAGQFGVGPLASAEEAGAALAGLTGTGTGAADEVSGNDTNAVTQVNETKLYRTLHEAVNAERRAADRSPLERRARLGDVATFHSEEMARTGRLGHEVPGEAGLAERYERFGLDCDRRGENVYKTSLGAGDETTFARSVVSDWMESSRNRKTLLDPAWEAQGFGIATAREDGEIRVYVTQNLC
ncbi:MAG: CAP domain-containing protein [Salinirussus sp.]